MGADFADLVAVVMADKRIQVGNDADGVQHIGGTGFAVGGNAVHAFVGQIHAGIAQQRDTFKNRLRNYGFHHIELQLSGFGGEGYGSVVADHFEAHLIHDFRNHGIDFGGHDGRTGLHFGQVDFLDACTRAG